MKKVYIWLQRIGYVLAGMLFLLFVCVYIAVQSGYIARKIQNITEHFFNQEHGCQFQGQVSKINLFPPCVEISGLTLQKPEERDWSIHVSHATLQFHLLDMVKKRQIGYDLILDGVHLQEQFDKVPHKIADFLGSLSSQDDSVLELKRIYIAQGLLVAAEKNDHMRFSSQYAGMVTLQRHGIYLNVQLDAGDLQYKDAAVLQNFSGSLQSFLPASQDQLDRYELDLDVHTDIPVVQEKQVHAKLRLQKGQVTATVTDAQQAILVDPITCNISDVDQPCSMHIGTDISVLRKKSIFSKYLQDVSGLVKLYVHCSMRDPLATLQGNIAIYELQYASEQVADHIDIAWNRRDTDHYQGSIHVDGVELFSGNLHVSDTGELCVDVCNEQSLLIPSTYWQVPARSCRTRIQMRDGSLRTQYIAALFSSKLQEQFVIQGKGSVTPHTISFDTEVGKFGKALVQGDWQQFPYIHTIKYWWKDMLVAALDIQAKTVSGSLQGRALRSMFEKGQQFVVSQDGRLVFDGKVDNKKITGNIFMKDGHVRLPYLYNVMQEGSLQYEVSFWPLVLHIKNMKGTLYEGEFTSPHMWFAYMNNHVSTYAPVIFDNVLLSWQKGLAAVLSGYVLTQKEHGSFAHINADLVIQSAQVQSNIFSEDFIQNITRRFSSDLQDRAYTYDVRIVTKKPIAVQTSFLQTQAELQLHASSTKEGPQVQGEVNLQQGGVFKFPYKSLDVVEGKISFTPEHSFDPLLHVVARGRVKRYDITMRVSGSAQMPRVSFSSVPHLPEQQVISLLLFGADDESITIMPDFVKTQVQDIVFGPALPQDSLAARFNRLLEPLKYVRFYPKFANQQGRGGMRGVVEIEASERLKGKIDSNFFQLEDTRFEVDYDITDELTARAVRDGPATYGAELELRWKW